MKVGLCIPCYTNAVAPEVGVSSYKLLKYFGFDVEYPEGQTCCGQPMANGGFQSEAKCLARKFDTLFGKYEYIVAPSSSCVMFIREHYCEMLGYKETEYARNRLFEMCEFIHDVVKPSSLNARFPHKVSIHNSCHGVRLAGLSSPSELNIPYFSKLRNLLSLVADIEILEPERPDECCGFGGLFSVEESAVSIKMGTDKIKRHMATGAEYIVGADSSCLMHQSGIISANGFPIKTIHILEILAQGL